MSPLTAGEDPQPAHEPDHDRVERSEAALVRDAARRSLLRDVVFLATVLGTLDWRLSAEDDEILLGESIERLADQIFAGCWEAEAEMFPAPTYLMSGQIGALARARGAVQREVPSALSPEHHSRLNDQSEWLRTLLIEVTEKLAKILREPG